MINENKKKPSPETERNQFFNFLEELCWLIDENKDINFKSISKYFKEYRNSSSHNLISNDKNSEFALIGILPSLLKDQEIFQSNLQLVQFANEVLALSIPRWEKKSRNELIGLIICEVEDANKERINTLSEWSKNIFNNKNAVKELQKKAVNSGNLFSWNEAIQNLIGTGNE